MIFNGLTKTNFKVGEKYLIRTATMCLVGRIVSVDGLEILIQNASWVADTGRFYDMLKNGLENIDHSEIEPFIDDVIVGRLSLIDATPYKHKLPVNQKS